MRRDSRKMYMRCLYLLACCFVVSALTGCLPVKIKGTLHNGKADGYYKAKLEATGGSGKYTFSLVDGMLPSGLSLDQHGTITGTITAGTGLYAFKVKAADAILPGDTYSETKAMAIQVDNTPYKWTIIAHFAVDNNIDYEFEKKAGLVTLYLETLEQIEAKDTANNIQILLMLDAYNPDTKFSDGYYYLSGGDIAGDKMKGLTEINSGSLDDTEAFLDWAFAQYPSEHYLYTIFNHGSGFDDQNREGMRIYGIGFDDSNDQDSLTHYELGEALSYLKQKIGHKVDLFYPYACLMGGVELAYEVRNSADYLLSSEELSPADIFSYQSLDAILSNPDIGAEALGKIFCDDAYLYLVLRLINPRPFTLSLVDLARIDDLSTAIDTYALAAMSDINANPGVAAQYNQAADDSFTMYKQLKMDDFYYVDLGDYLDHIMNSPGIGGSVKIQASEVKAVYADAVLYQRVYKYPQASGMTIFHNIWGSEFSYAPNTYHEILLFGVNAWKDYVSLLDSLKP